MTSDFYKQNFLFAYILAS